jgi:hypothetical protein
MRLLIYPIFFLLDVSSPVCSRLVGRVDETEQSWPRELQSHVYCSGSGSTASINGREIKCNCGNPCKKNKDCGTEETSACFECINNVCDSSVDFGSFSDDAAQNDTLTDDTQNGTLTGDTQNGTLTDAQDGINDVMDEICSGAGNWQVTQVSGNGELDCNCGETCNNDKDCGKPGTSLCAYCSKKNKCGVVPV